LPYTVREAVSLILNKKQFAVGIFLDLTKASDVINHDFLLAKLELYGLRGKIHAWMSSYLFFLISEVGLWVLRPLTGLMYQPRMIGDGDCGEIGGMKMGKGN
jgi:hypothetical protein